MLQEESSRPEPFLSPEDIPTPIENNNEISNNNNNEHHYDQLQFYDPTAILDISREVAFGYLILLTGGAVEYEAPILEEVQQQKDTTIVTPNQQKSTPSSTLDEESASLAYASIVDGNVLYTCFGLKTIVGNNSSTIPTIGGKQHSSSIFCCFPDASLDALQLVLPQSSKNKLKMQKLCDVLRDVSDLHLETLENEGTSSLSATPTKIPLYLQIINAYVNLFKSIVRYHDTKKHLKKKNDKGVDKKKNDIFYCCSDIFLKLNPFSSKKSKNAALEQLQKDTLLDIGNSFKELNSDIWESLENVATQTAFTGVSVE